jgi:NAD(P)-dependent dehydrogenase (short-subunit alcohol dehydrogenase family)
MSKRLLGKVALITGAAQGIGAAIAKVFAGEGASLVLFDIKIDQLQLLKDEIENKWAIPVLVYKIDVTDEKGIGKAINETLESLGEIDVLVNNAGINAFHNFLSMTTEQWEKCLSVNLMGTMNCCKAVLTRMAPRRCGSIINIASVHSHKIVKGAFPYTVSKHALIGLTKSLAIEFANMGIRVNSISPGLIDTPLAQAYFDSFDDPQEQRKTQENLIPAKRIGDAEEVANTALFLASDEAKFINAVDILVDGGRSQIYCD